MSAPIDEGGPAFPGQPWPDRAGVYEKSPGISIRDWFAGQALHALISKVSAKDTRGIMAPVISDEEACEWRQAITRGAYRYADAMLAERKRGASGG